MGFLSRLTGAEQAGNAARRAAGVLQAGVEEGKGALSDFSPQIANLISSGAAGQQDFLGQAGAQFGNIASLTDPALANLQATATAGGRSSALQDILGDPNQEALFGQVARQTANDLSGLGLRRSGFGVDTSQRAKLDFAGGLLDRQDAAQQNLANVGIGGTSSIANLLAQQGQVAGREGTALAGAKQNELQQLLQLINAGSGAEAAGITGAANAELAGRGSLFGLLGAGGAAALGNPSFFA